MRNVAISTVALIALFSAILATSHAQDGGGTGGQGGRKSQASLVAGGGTGAGVRRGHETGNELSQERIGITNTGGRMVCERGGESSGGCKGNTLLLADGGNSSGGRKGGDGVGGRFVCDGSSGVSGGRRGGMGVGPRVLA